MAVWYPPKEKPRPPSSLVASPEMRRQLGHVLGFLHAERERALGIPVAADVHRDDVGHLGEAFGEEPVLVAVAVHEDPRGHENGLPLARLRDACSAA